MLILTFSRTAWISLIVSLVFCGLLFDKKYFKFAFIIAVALVGLDKILNIGRFDPLRAAEDSSIMYRLEIWKSCFKIIKDNLITGIGFGTLFKYITSYSSVVKPNVEHCHNLYIQIIIETGIIGFSLFLFIFSNLIKNLFYKASKTKNNPQVTTSWTIIIMILIHGLVDSVFFTPQIMMILSIYIGIMLNEHNKYPIAVSNNMNEYLINYSNDDERKVG